MRAIIAIVLSLSAAFAAAQNSTQPNAFNIPAGQSSYQVTAGGTVALSWGNPQGSTVTIKLQADNNQITPSSGVVLAQSIPNTGSTSVSIPAGSNIPQGAYTFEIIDDSDSSAINFSPAFQIAGASGTGTFAAGTATATGSTAFTNSTTSTTTTSSTTSSSASTSSTSSSTSSSTRSSSSASNTAVPNSNAGVKTQAPLAAAVILGAAAFL